MRRMYAGLMALVLLGVLAGTAWAKTSAIADPHRTAAVSTADSGGNVPVAAPGLTPDKPFYWLKRLLEHLRIVITHDAGIQTELLVYQADVRMAEAWAMASAGKAELAAKAMVEGRVHLDAAQEHLPNGKAGGQDAARLTQKLQAKTETWSALLTKIARPAPGQSAGFGDDADYEARRRLQPRTLLVLDRMATAAGLPLGEVVQLFDEHPGVGRVEKELNVKMGPILSELAHGQMAATGRIVR